MKNKDATYLAIKHVANELNIKESDVREVISKYPPYLKELMKRGFFEGLRLPYFGRFYANSVAVLAGTNNISYKQLVELNGGFVKPYSPYKFKNMYTNNKPDIDTQDEEVH